MTRNVWMAAAFACAASVGAGAQSATSATGSAADTAANGNPITITGCVQNISSKGAIGTTERGFMLAPVAGSTPTALATPGSTEGAAAGNPPATAAGGTSSGASGTSGTSSAAGAGSPTGTSGISPTGHPSPSAASSYMLVGHDSELKDHVGHKVEVTGTLETTADATKGSSSTAPATMADSTKLHVSAVKLIASDCSAKEK